MSFQRHLPEVPEHISLTAAKTKLRLLSGLVAGTHVLTRNGYQSVETLRPGRYVVTRDHGVAEVATVKRFTARSRMVRFRKDALESDVATCDVLLPAHQLVLVTDWRAGALFGKHEAKVQAAGLVDDAYVVDAGMQEIDCVQVFLAKPSVLYLQGMQSLSAHDFDDMMRPIQD